MSDPIKSELESLRAENKALRELLSIYKKQLKIAEKSINDLRKKRVNYYDSR